MSKKNKRPGPKPSTPQPPSKALMLVPVVLLVAGVIIWAISAGRFRSNPTVSDSSTESQTSVSTATIAPPNGANSATQGSPFSTIPDAATNVPELGPTEKASVLQNHGNELLKQGQYAEAIAAYQAAVKITPEDEDSHYNLAFALAKSGDREGAVKEYQEALRIYPDYTEAHNNLGNVLLNENKLDEAITHFKAALALAADDPLTQNNLGHGLALQGKTAEAVPCFKEALRLKPDLLEARNNLAVAYMQLKKPKDAIVEFQAILKQQPDFQPAQKGLARAQRMLGK